jgi:hypothetical protein
MGDVRHFVGSMVVSVVRVLWFFVVRDAEADPLCAAVLDIVSSFQYCFTIPCLGLEQGEYRQLCRILWRCQQ